MKRYDEHTDFDKELNSLSDFKLTEQESSDSYQRIISGISKEKKQEKIRFYFSKTMVTFSTLIVLTVVGWFLYQVLNPEFNVATQPSESNLMNGIELELTLEKDTYSLDEEIVAKVTLTNHNDTDKEIYVPIPTDVEAGISAVMVEKEGQMLWQFLTPDTEQEISNITDRTLYDFVLVKLAANETIEQEFRWNWILFSQKSRESVPAGHGEYILSTFIILDELNSQQDYYQPEKQLISKLNFTISDLN